MIAPVSVPGAFDQVIEGTVTGMDSSALADRYVMLVQPIRTDPVNPSAFTLQPIRIARTTVQGEYSFGPLSPGEYQLLTEEDPALDLPLPAVAPGTLPPGLGLSALDLNHNLQTQIQDTLSTGPRIGSLVGINVMMGPTLDVPPLNPGGEPQFAPWPPVWATEPTVTIHGNCTEQAQVRCLMVEPEPVFAPGELRIGQFVITNPGKGYSIYGSDGQLGTAGSYYWEISGTEFAPAGFVPRAMTGQGDISQNNPAWLGVHSGLNNNPYLNLAIDGRIPPGGSPFGESFGDINTDGDRWRVPTLATLTGDFANAVATYASDYQVFIGPEYPPGHVRTALVFSNSAFSRPTALLLPGTYLGRIGPVNELNLELPTSLALTDLEQTYGLAQFINGLQKKMIDALDTAVTDVTGVGQGGVPLYFDIMYGANNSVQKSLRQGEFGDPNSAAARLQVNLLKGYLGKELLIRPVLLDDTVPAYLGDAQLENSNSRVQAVLAELATDSITNVAAIVANILYQGTQAIANTISGVTPNLFQSVSREWRSLTQQSFGSLQDTPPSWLQGQSFAATLGTGQTVTYTFNPTGYTRVVSPP